MPAGLGISGLKVARRITHVMLAVSAGMGGNAAYADAKPQDANRVRAIVDGAAAHYLRDNPKASAIAIGVVYGPSNFQFSYGTLVPGKARPPREDTLFPLASITKTFTGTLLAKAVLQKRLALSDDIRKYLDGEFPNLEYEGHPIRIRDLLDHRSGLPFMLPNRPELMPDYQADSRPYATRVNEATKTYGRAQFFVDLRKVKLTSAPGTSYQYSNAAAQLAAYILEKLYHRSYEQLLHAFILAPLKMTNTTITLNRPELGRLAPGWDDKGRLAPLSNWLPAAGAMKSTAGDMLKYVSQQVDEVDPAVRLSHQLVWTAKGHPFGEQGTFGIGLNWQVAELAGRRVIFQDGMIEGYSALVVAEPESKVGVVVMTNQLDPKSAVANRLLLKDILARLAPNAVPLPE